MAEERTIVKQGRDFFSRLALWQKIVLVGAPIIMIIGLVILISTAGPGEMEVLFSGLETQNAGEVTRYLKENNIPYQLSSGGSAILVEKDKVHDLRLQLASDGMPGTGVVGYELFDQTNLGMSEFVQRLNYRRALEGELAKTISSIDEVQKARVHIVIPERALFTEDQKPPTASVTLHFKHGNSLNSGSIKGIQTLVASSIEGLNTDNVTIVDQKGKLISSAPVDESSVAGISSRQHQQQRQVEQYLTDKVQRMLDGVLGVDNSNVSITAELDFTQIEQTKTDYDPDRQVVRSEQTINETSLSSDSLNNTAASQSRQQTNTITNYEIAQSTERIVHSTGSIKRLSVAAMINGKYEVLDTNGNKELVYVPRSDDEMQNLTDIVRNAVGYDPSRNDQLSVINVPFDTQLLEDEYDFLREAPWYDNPDNVKLLALLGVMLLTIFIMYKLLANRQIRERTRIAMELPENVSMEEEEDEDVAAVEEGLEDLELDEEDMLLLPAELPDQLLLEGDREEEHLDVDDETDTPEFKGESLASRARSKLGRFTGKDAEMTEETMMKMEIKNKVEDFIELNTPEAAKFVRMMLNQDNEDRQKF